MMGVRFAERVVCAARSQWPLPLARGASANRAQSSPLRPSSHWGKLDFGKNLDNPWYGRVCAEKCGVFMKYLGWVVE